MGRTLVLMIWLATVLPLGSVAAYAAERRVALVIGNGAYERTATLPNPGNDARDASAALRANGFEVVTGVDLGQRRMEEIVIEFARAVRDADVALFYYAGHALQFDGVNYLIPVDAVLSDEADLRRLVRLDEVLGDLREARKLSIVVLDACRDNPLADVLRRSVGTTRAAVSLQPGLARVESREGFLISFATQSGRTAADGHGRNSPYTEAFLRHIGTSEEIGTVFRRIAGDVHKATGGRQLPELSMSLISTEYYLAGRPLGVAPQVPAPDPVAAAWSAIAGSDDPAVFDAFISQYPDGIYAALARERRAAMAPRQSAPEKRSTNGNFPFKAMITVKSNLLAKPSQLSARLRSLSVGETVTVTGQAAAAMWYQVRDNSGVDGFLPKERVRALD